MYRRLKNHVLRKRGAEKKTTKACVPRQLISSEPIAHLRSDESTADAATDPHSISSTVRCATGLLRTTQTTVLPSTAEQGTCTSSAYTCDVDLRSRHDGLCAPAASSSSSSTNTTSTTDTRGRQRDTLMHPMLSADSGVEVDGLESSCCSCADDVFTDDEDLLDDDGWQISAHDVSLDKVINETSCGTVYR